MPPAWIWGMLPLGVWIIHNLHGSVSQGGVAWSKMLHHSPICPIHCSSLLNVHIIQNMYLCTTAPQPKYVQFIVSNCIGILQCICIFPRKYHSPLQWYKILEHYNITLWYSLLHNCTILHNITQLYNLFQVKSTLHWFTATDFFTTAERLHCQKRMICWFWFHQFTSFLQGVQNQTSSQF